MADLQRSSKFKYGKSKDPLTVAGSFARSPFLEDFDLRDDPPLTFAVKNTFIHNTGLDDEPMTIFTSKSISAPSRFYVRPDDMEDSIFGGEELRAASGPSRIVANTVETLDTLFAEDLGFGSIAESNDLEYRDLYHFPDAEGTTGRGDPLGTFARHNSNRDTLHAYDAAHTRGDVDASSYNSRYDNETFGREPESPPPIFSLKQVAPVTVPFPRGWPTDQPRLSAGPTSDSFCRYKGDYRFESCTNETYAGGKGDGNYLSFSRGESSAPSHDKGKGFIGSSKVQPSWCPSGYGVSPGLPRKICNENISFSHHGDALTSDFVDIPGYDGKGSLRVVESTGFIDSKMGQPSWSGGIFDDIDVFSDDGDGVHASISEELARARRVASLGSEGHEAGTCNPCAHNWRAAGCATGWACDFCHLCEPGERKRRKRIKQDRLRSEQKRFAASASVAAEFAAATAKQLQKAGQNSKAPLSTADEDTSTGVVANAPAPQNQVVLGGLTVTYGGGSSSTGDFDVTAANSPALQISGWTAQVTWSVDARRFKQQKNRCGVSRRFGLRIGDCGGEEGVPFLLHVLPCAPSGEFRKKKDGSCDAGFARDAGFAPLGSDAAELASSYASSLAKSMPNQWTALTCQLKCIDPGGLPKPPPQLWVAFSIGGQQAREASVCHDFSVEPLCALLPDTDVWAASASSATPCVVKVLLEVLTGL